MARIAALGERISDEPGPCRCSSCCRGCGRGLCGSARRSFHHHGLPEPHVLVLGQLRSRVVGAAPGLGAGQLLQQRQGPVPSEGRGLHDLRPPRPRWRPSSRRNVEDRHLRPAFRSWRAPGGDLASHIPLLLPPARKAAGPAGEGLRHVHDGGRYRVGRHRRPSARTATGQRCRRRAGVLDGRRSPSGGARNPGESGDGGVPGGPGSS